MLTALDNFLFMSSVQGKRQGPHTLWGSVLSWWCKEAEAGHLGWAAGGGQEGTIPSASQRAWQRELVETRVSSGASFVGLSPNDSLSVKVS